MRERGVDPYPVTLRPRPHRRRDPRDASPASEPGADSGESVSVAGRLMPSAATAGSCSPTSATRPERSSCSRPARSSATTGFDDVNDARPRRLDRRRRARDHDARRRRALDPGARVSRCWRSRCAPLPDKHHGLTDVDTRLRQRYLDLIVNPDSRRIFDIRSTVIAAGPRVLIDRGFTEVETPVLARRPAAPRRGRSSPTTTRSTSTCTCGSRSSCRSSGCVVGGIRARLRDRPRLPQRGPRHPPQPRVHAARGLPGARRLPRHDGPGGDDRLEAAARRDRHDGDRRRRPARSTSSRRGGASRWPS